MPTTELLDLDVDDGVYYPSSDGKPMAETPAHARCMVLLFQALEDYFRSQPDTYLAINMNWYWEQGNAMARRAPDVMVIPGVGQKDRNSFRSWNEGGAVPAVCFEMASKRTWKANLGGVRLDYERNGVREYFVFDPRFQFLDQPLVGFRLVKGRYVSIRTEMDGGMTSNQLGLRFLPEGEHLRVIVAATGERLLTRQERIRQQETSVAEEKARAEQLEAEIERLKAQIKSSGKTNGSK